MVVPKELRPPAKFNRWAPVEGDPSAKAKGCAAVCCKEKPKATIKSDTSIMLKELAFVLGIMIKAPIIEMTSPVIIEFLYPILLIMSNFKKVDAR